MLWCAASPLYHWHCQPVHLCHYMIFGSAIKEAGQLQFDDPVNILNHPSLCVC